MTDYKKLRKYCEDQRLISAKAIDDFLVYYAAAKEGLKDEFDSRVKRFRHITEGVNPSWLPSILPQYIAHRVFRTGGLIKKFLNHAAVKKLDPKEFAYLELLSNTPWRFCFSQILSSPAKDFYEMEDVFTGETFLLYSKSIKIILSEQDIMLWFNLISFTGQCWEIYGPIGSYPTFDVDDIFFYASELDKSVVSDETLCDYVEKYPVPFMMLIAGANYPLMINQGYEVVQVSGETNDQEIDIKKLQKKFKVEYAHGVFRITHEKLSIPPHSAEAFYEEATETISVTALTDLGYEKMANMLIKSGIKVPDEPDIRIHIPMLKFINEAFKKELTLLPHSHLFEVTPEPEETEMMEKLNAALQLLLPYFDKGEMPALDEIAKKSGLPVDTLSELIEQLSGSVKKAKKSKKKGK